MLDERGRRPSAAGSDGRPTVPCASAASGSSAAGEAEAFGCDSVDALLERTSSDVGGELRPPLLSLVIAAAGSASTYAEAEAAEDMANRRGAAEADFGEGAVSVGPGVGVAVHQPRRDSPWPCGSDSSVGGGPHSATATRVAARHSERLARGHAADCEDF